MHFTSYLDEAVPFAQDLVNTYNVVYQREKMPDSAALSVFLLAHGIRLPTAPTAADLEAAHRLRTTFRRLFEGTSEVEAVETLNSILLDHHVSPEFVRHDDEPWHLHVITRAESPVATFAGLAAMGLLGAIASGGIDRLLTCVGNRCGEVFVDVSRNRSRRYCSPEICGNRAHATARRARDRQQRSTVVEDR